MKYIDYIERKQQGSFSFPIGFYHMTPLSPRYLMPYHQHTHYEIIRIVSGSFQLQLENENHLYHEGDVLFIPGGTLHGGTPYDCVYDCVVFDMQILMKDNHTCSKFVRDILMHKISIPTHLSEKCDDILPLVTTLCNALASKESGFEFMVQGYLYHFLGIIINKGIYEKEEINRVSAERITSIKNVLAYITENYQHRISLETLSKIAGMNPKYFCRYFRSITNRTPIDYYRMCLRNAFYKGYFH